MPRAASLFRPLLIAAVAVLVVGAAWLLGRRSAAPAPAPAAPSADVAARIQQLVGQLDGDTDAALDGLVALGDPAVPALVAALNTPDDDRRMRIVEVFEHTRSPAAVAPLLRLLQTAPPDVRIDAITALAEIGDRRAVQPLQDHYAKDDSPQVRYEVLTSLGRLGDPRSVPLMLDAARNSDQYMRLWSIDALCTMKAPEARETAARLVDDPSLYVRRRVLRVCAPQLATPATDDAIIARAVRDPDFESSVWARRVIAQRLTDGTERDQLVARMHRAADPLVTGPTTPQQFQAAFLLAELRDGSMIDQLVAALRSPDVLIRQHAAFLLGQAGPARGVPGLVMALRDEQAIVRQTAHLMLQDMAASGEPAARAALAPPTP
jgi:HEAT repeat protein